MKLKLKIWRQELSEKKGEFKTYTLDHVDPDCSFLEMLDQLNEELIEKGEDPVSFDHDCREGICGMCSLNINGTPHGPQRGTTACQLHMRHFKDEDTIIIEPFWAKAFPIIKDLMVDRSSLDKIMQAGGFISVDTGAPQDANAILIAKDKLEAAMDAASCIGCGACVSACKNASAMLFLAAKAMHLNTLPQGEPEKGKRALAMVQAMEEEGFGACSNYGECQAVCPKNISLDCISKLHRDYAKATLKTIIE